jgi:predicted TIM-barrel fold metal-dependent hydrolase
MSGIARVVDAHVHHWSPERGDLFPFLVDEENLKSMVGLSDVSQLRRPFDRDTLLEESVPWNVVKYVHVSCAMGADVSYTAETQERQEGADRIGQPDALIGSIHPGLTGPEIVAELDEQATAQRFRGVRVNGGIDHTSDQAATLLEALQDRGLSYEMWVHPKDMAAAAEVISRYDRLQVVVGHMGWPLSAKPDERALWQDGMTTFASLGERMHCKLSGLVATLQRLDDDAFRQWIDYAIDTFGDTRCFFASNFPVDSTAGTYDELFSLYDRVTAHRDDAARARLFADNAERFYRI